MSLFDKFLSSELCCCHRSYDTRIVPHIELFAVTFFQNSHLIFLLFSVGTCIAELQMSMTSKPNATNMSQPPDTYITC